MNKKTCRIPECQKTVHRGDLCYSHFCQQRKRIEKAEKAFKNKKRWEWWQQKQKAAHEKTLLRLRVSNARRRAAQKQTVCNLTKEQATEILNYGCFFAYEGNCRGDLILAHDIAVERYGNTNLANIFCLCQGHNLRMKKKALAEILKQGKLVAN